MFKRIKKNQSERLAVIYDIKTYEYKQALNLQYQLVNQKIEDKDKPDVLIIVEHPSVFTLGKRGGTENLIVSKDFLVSKNIEIVQTERGGNITYHGPGQAVLYPIVDLEAKKIGVKDFVYGLEEVVKQTISDFNLLANRSKKNHGLWIDNKKIASIGISVKKGISFHGIALNAIMDLEPFSWINPCGLDNVFMTSIKKEIEQNKRPCNVPKMDEIKAALIKNVTNIFNLKIEESHESIKI